MGGELNIQSARVVSQHQAIILVLCYVEMSNICRVLASQK